jgi:hypothetical protein
MQEYKKPQMEDSLLMYVIYNTTQHDVARPNTMWHGELW